VALKFSSRDVAHTGDQSKDSKGHIAKMWVMLYRVQEIILKYSSPSMRSIYQERRGGKI